MSFKRRPLQKIPCESNQRRGTCIRERNTPHANNRSCSTGTININNVVKPKKTTKSESIVSDKGKLGCPTKLNNCQACGDVSHTKKKSNMSINIGVRNSGVQQYFRNKNFKESSASIYGGGSLKKVSNLNTINESEENLQEGECFDSKSDETEIIDDITELRRFRRENYFECHSTAAKLKASLVDHRCQYRFYLNERLFPVPVAADYNDVARCVECHLPLNENSREMRGTIQAKVKINGQLQDMTLMLPVRRSLIIKERRRAETKETLYFGIVKLGQDGELFQRNRADSLALRYQRGYQRHEQVRRYEYERVRCNDVIVI